MCQVWRVKFWKVRWTFQMQSWCRCTLAGPIRREWGSLNLCCLVYWGWNFPHSLRVGPASTVLNRNNVFFFYIVRAIDPNGENKLPKFHSECSYHVVTQNYHQKARYDFPWYTTGLMFWGLWKLNLQDVTWTSWFSCQLGVFLSHA